MANTGAVAISTATYAALAATFLDGSGGACCGGYCMSLDGAADKAAVAAAVEKAALCAGAADAGVQTFDGMFFPPARKRRGADRM